MISNLTGFFPTPIMPAYTLHQWIQIGINSIIVVLIILAFVGLDKWLQHRKKHSTNEKKE